MDCDARDGRNRFVAYYELLGKLVIGWPASSEFRAKERYQYATDVPTYFQGGQVKGTRGHCWWWKVCLQLFLFLKRSNLHDIASGVVYNKQRQDSSKISTIPFVSCFGALEIHVLVDFRESVHADFEGLLCLILVHQWRIYFDRPSMQITSCNTLELSFNSN